MIYQVRATLFFESAQIPEDIRQALLAVWQHAVVVNPGQPDQEFSWVEVARCYHDEQPHQPCEQVFYRDNCPPPPD